MLILFLALGAVASSGPTLAGDPVSVEEDAAGAVATPGSGEFWSVGFMYQALTQEQTKAAYKQIYGVQAEYLRRLQGPHALRGELTAFYDTGHLGILDPTWSISSRELNLLGTSIGGSYVYSLGDPWERRSVLPYVGAGVGILLAIERLDLEGHGGDWDSLVVHRTGGRSALELHALAGAEFRLAAEIAGIVEARWVQAGDGSFSEWGEPGDEEERGIIRQADALARRPDFNLTGWRIQAGVRWRLK